MRAFLTGPAAKIVFIALIGGIILGLCWWLPLGHTEHPVVPLHKSLGTEILLPDKVVRQGFIADGKVYNGVILYSTLPLWTNHDLDVRIIDQYGRLRAQSEVIRASYLPANDTLKLTAVTPRFVSRRGEKLYIELRVSQGELVPLKATTINYYKQGDFSVNGQPLSKDLALTVRYAGPLSFGARQGVVAGVVLMVALAVVRFYVPPARQWFAVGVSLVSITPLALLGFWWSEGVLGIADWDYYFSLHESYRKILFEHGVFPFWNPYICGGTAGLGDPEFSVLSLTFLPELFLGVPLGARISVYVSVAVTALGTLFLARRLGLKVWGATTAALIVSFGSVSLLEIVEGHVNVWSAMWIPWIWWSWVGAVQDDRPRPPGWRGWLVPNTATLWCGVFLALAFFRGGIYLLSYTLMALPVVWVLSGRFKRAVWITMVAGGWGLALSAVKLLPVLLWLRQFPDPSYAVSAYFWPWLGEVLFGRHLHGTYLIFRQDSGWHEYGAYIGVAALFLGAVGLITWKTRRLVFLLMTAVGTVILLANSEPALQPWLDMLPWLPRSNISRVMIIAVLAWAILAGLGMDRLRTWRWSPLLQLVLIGVLAIDLMSLAYPLSEQAFTLPWVHDTHLPFAPPPLTFTRNRFDPFGEDTRTTRTYPALVQGYGVFAYCSVLGPAPAVIAIEDDRQSRTVMSDPPSTMVRVMNWSPNRVVVEAVATQPSSIHLNTNFAKGWQVNDQPAMSFNGLVGVQVPPGQHRLIFEYTAPGFRLGLLISLVAWLGLGWLVIDRFYKRA